MRLALLFAMAGSLADFKLVRTLDLKGPTHHVQGVDFDERHVWITSVDAPARKGYLHEFLLETGEADAHGGIAGRAPFSPGRHRGGRRIHLASRGRIPAPEHQRDRTAKQAHAGN